MWCFCARKVSFFYSLRRQSGGGEKGARTVLWMLGICALDCDCTDADVELSSGFTRVFVYVVEGYVGGLRLRKRRRASGSDRKGPETPTLVRCFFVSRGLGKGLE